MTDTVRLQTGQKIRSKDGQSYRLTDDAEVPALPVEAAKQQTNRHLAMICPDPVCQEKQRAALNGRLYVTRGTRGAAERWTMDQCGNCGTVKVFQIDGPAEPIEDGE
jgi:hypothetical protein